MIKRIVLLSMLCLPLCLSAQETNLKNAMFRYLNINGYSNMTGMKELSQKVLWELNRKMDLSGYKELDEQDRQILFTDGYYKYYVDNNSRKEAGLFSILLLRVGLTDDAERKKVVDTFNSLNFNNKFSEVPTQSQVVDTYVEVFAAPGPLTVDEALVFGVSILKRALYNYLDGETSVHTGLKIMADQALQKLLKDMNTSSATFDGKKILPAKQTSLLFIGGFYDYLVENEPLEAANLSSLLLNYTTGYQANTKKVIDAVNSMDFIGIKLSENPSDDEIEALRLKVKQVQSNSGEVKTGIRAAMFAYLNITGTDADNPTSDLIQKTLEKIVDAIEAGTFGQVEKDILFKRYEDSLNGNVYLHLTEVDAILLGAKLYKFCLGPIGADNARLIATRFANTNLVPGGLRLVDLDTRELDMEKTISDLKIEFKGTTVLAK